MLNWNDKCGYKESDAVAYRIHFTAMICSYGNTNWDEIEEYDCNRCHHLVQINDFLTSRSSCLKKDGSMLDTYHYGVKEEIRNELIRQFDITENDFRPCRNKKGEIVYYQITPQHTMLPIALLNNWKQLKPCRKCGRMQFRAKNVLLNENYPTFISQEALNDLHDINRTFETFEMHIPDYIVSKRVYDFFEEKYPRLLFDPLFLK